MTGFSSQRRFGSDAVGRMLLILIALMATIGGSYGSAWAGGTLAKIREKGILVAGVKDSSPPFGFVDEKTHMLAGYDVDFCKAIAKRLGVRLEVQPVTSATRIPKLMAGTIDLIAATMTKTSDRAKQIDFSYTYFLTGQKFLTKRGTISRLADLEGKTIGTIKGSTSEDKVRKILPPSALIIAFDDSRQAFLALQQGRVAAIVADEATLAGLLARDVTRKAYEIPDIAILDEPYGMGVRKEDVDFLNFINATLLQMEKSGEAARIFNKWFGPQSETPRQRSFSITAGR